MIPQQPRSTLFPYTTLFRSDTKAPKAIPVSKKSSSKGCCARHGGPSISCSTDGKMLCKDQSTSPSCACTERKITRSEEHTSELQSRVDLVCRLLLEKKKKKK